MSGAVHILPLYAFMAWTGTTLLPLLHYKKARFYTTFALTFNLCEVNFGKICSSISIMYSTLRPLKGVSWTVGVTALDASSFLPTVAFPNTPSPPDVCQVT
jgi:hypothetical protein